MTIRVLRWLACDFPGCPHTFDQERYRTTRETNGTVKSLREAAATWRWIVTEHGDDLCPEHADVHANRPPQPTLFPMSDAGDGV